MQSKFKFLLFVLLISSLSVFSSQDTQALQIFQQYYVDNQHPNAADIPAHGSLDQPWETLDYALLQLEPGDTLIVRAGTYKNGHIKLTSENSGQVGMPITVVAYPNETVVLEEGGSLIFQGANWWIIDGLIFDDFRSQAIHLGAHQALGEIGGVCPDCDQTILTERVTIRNCEFRNSVRTPISLNYANDILIDNNYFHHIRPGTPFKNDQGEQVGYEINAIDIRYKGRNIVVSNNRFEDIGSDGVQVGAQAWKSGSDLNNISIINNQFWVNRPYTGILGNVGENGIDIKESTGILISGNTIHGFRPTTPQQDASGANGDGIVIHNGAQEVIIEKNLFSDNTVHLVISEGADPSPEGTRQVIVRNNIFRQAKAVTGDKNNEGLAVRLSVVADVQIHHNTFYENEVYLRSWDVQNSEFKNNVVIQGEARFSGSQVELEASHNAWSQTEPIPSLLQNRRDIEQDDFMLDAQLRPLAGSPLVDMGVNLGITNDFEDKPRLDERPDLGAFEFGGFAVNPTARGIAPGESASYYLLFTPSLDLPGAITLTITTPAPDLILEPETLVMNPGETQVLTVTDTHTPDITLNPGIWNTITIDVAQGGIVKQTTNVYLLVGGTKVFLPSILADTTYPDE